MILMRSVIDKERIDFNFSESVRVLFFFFYKCVRDLILLDYINGKSWLVCYVFMIVLVFYIVKLDKIRLFCIYLSF